MWLVELVHFAGSVLRAAAPRLCIMADDRALVGAKEVTYIAGLSFVAYLESGDTD